MLLLLWMLLKKKAHLRSKILKFLLQFAVLFTLLFCHKLSIAQQSSPPFQDILVQQDTIQYAFVPALIYTSDLGLVGGGLIQRYDYSDGFSPYRNSIHAQILLSTKGLINVRTSLEHTETFGRDIRSLWEIRGFRLFDDNYFGIGNDTNYDSDLWSNRFYNYESRSVGFRYRGRIPIYRGNNAQRLDVISLINISYFTPFVDESDNILINLDRPLGFDGGFINFLGSGLQWESRDSEFSPTKGFTFRVDATLSHEWLLSDYRFGSIEAVATNYYTLPYTFETVLAFLGGGKITIGDAPFHYLADLGGEDRLRGFPLFRFRGDHALWYSAELRNWLYHNKLYDFKVGLHAFTDGGRVYTNGERFTLDNLHHTFGGGVAFQLFTPDFILRIEYAQSPDMGRLYMGVGYMF